MSAIVVLMAVVLTATSLLCVLSLAACVYLWRKDSRAQGHIQDLTATMYAINTEKQVLLERTNKPFFGKTSSAIH